MVQAFSLSQKNGGTEKKKIDEKADDGKQEDNQEGDGIPIAHGL